MPFAFGIDHDLGFAYLRGSDPIDEEVWLAALRDLAALPDFASGTPLLWDMSAISILPPVGKVARRAEEARSVTSNRRVALIVRTGAAFGVGRQIAMITGDHMRPFTDVDEARRWLTMPSAAA